MDLSKTKINGIGDVPIGVEKVSLDINMFNIKNKYISIVSAQELASIRSFALGISQVLSHDVESKMTILDPENMLFLNEKLGFEIVNSNFDKVVQSIFDEVLLRNNSFKESNLDNNLLKTFDEKVYLIFGLKALYAKLKSKSKENLEALLDKGDAMYNVHFIVIDSVDDVDFYSNQDWFRHKFAGTDGIWIGNGITDQSLFRLSKTSISLSEDIGEEFGYVLSKAKTQHL